RRNIRGADKFNVSRMFIAGGASQVPSPMGSQGLNSSVQDSVTWKLSLVVKKRSPLSLLSTYETEHVPPIKEMLKLSTNLRTQSIDLTSKDTFQSRKPGFCR
ncbi:hypothetical protein BS47DRAFT_1310220, partial [Hydnum rufescens UP504]